MKMNKKARIAAIALCIAMLALSAAACKSQDQIEEQKNIVASTQSTDGYYDTRSTVGDRHRHRKHSRISPR